MNFVEHHTPGEPSLRWIERAGSGPPILFLHGVCRCSEDFEPLWPHLSSNCRIIAPDQRGHGKSQRGPRYLVTDYAADAIALAYDEIREPGIIYGHSLGAMVAMAIAAALPALVRGVVLEDPPFHTMGRHIAGTNWHMQFTAMREIARRGGSVPDFTDALSEMLLPQRDGTAKRLGELRDRASLQWSAQCLSRLDPDVLTPIIEGRWLDGYAMTTIFSHIRCPALLLQADPTAGGALTDSDTHLAADTIGSCEVVRFPGRGHLLHWLEPSRIGQLIESFMSSIRK